MIDAAILDAMVAAGASPEVIAAAVKADNDKEIARRISKRMKDAERKREQRAREKESEMSRGHDVTSTESSGHAVTKESPPAPPKETTTLSSLRSDKAASDPRKLLFGEGLSTLQSLTGRTEGGLRTMLGRWLRDSDDDALRVMTIIAKAARDKPAEPIAWIERHFQSRAPPGNGSSSKPSSAQAAVDVLERLKTSKPAIRSSDFGAGGSLEGSDYRRAG